MGIFRKKKENPDLLKTFDGRIVKYVTKRKTDKDGNVKHLIVGKEGRIADIDGELRIICGEKDIFRCKVQDSKYYLLLSGDGVMVEGNNTVTGEYDILTAYYSYYRK